MQSVADLLIGSPVSKAHIGKGFYNSLKIINNKIIIRPVRSNKIVSNKI